MARQIQSESIKEAIERELDGVIVDFKYGEAGWQAVVRKCTRWDKDRPQDIMVYFAYEGQDHRLWCETKPHSTYHHYWATSGYTDLTVVIEDGDSFTTAWNDKANWENL